MFAALRFAWLSIALSGLISATPITIGDPSFEVNSLGPGENDEDLSPEWQETAGPGNNFGFEDYQPGFAAAGTDHLAIEFSHDVWQDLAATYQTDTRYTLTVAAGNREGITQPANETRYYLADSTGTIFATGIFNASTLAAGTFADAPPLIFDTPANPAAVGQTIRILLQARGAGRSHFDHLRLDATALIPPGGATLHTDAATAVATTNATLNGTVTAIGNDEPVVTFFWGTTAGDLNPASWQDSLTLPGSHASTFSGNISGLAPGTTYFFIARATNSAGDSWALPPKSFETLPLPPLVTHLPVADITATSAIAGATVSSVGSGDPVVTIYHGPADGGTTPANWASSTAVSGSAGDFVATLDGLAPGSTTYFRVHAENAGGSTWAASTFSFTTLTVNLPAVENRSASGITGTTASLRGEVTGEGNETPSITVFYGTSDGGTNPAGWESSVDSGPQSGDFSFFVTGLTPQTPYYFRSRATNAAGSSWAPDTATFVTTPLVPDTAVINEFHFKPFDGTELEEFIELHNPGDSTLDLSGWSLTDAVEYTFPPGTSLAPGGFLVVAENPSFILSNYGKTALGPWTGKLNSSGEDIELRDETGTLRDRVNYGVGFPWPTGADGSGSSAELLDPSLDNDVGGSWRSSGTVFFPPTVYIPSQATGWKYKKGTAEASDPVDDWRTPAFDDSGWDEGQTGIGYSDSGLNTTLADMKNTYGSVYFRKSFTVEAGDIPEEIHLRVSIDDAWVIWINGVEVHRRATASGQLAYSFLNGSGHNNDWEDVTLTNADSYLVGGTNVIAVHAFNASIDSPDFSMDLELATDAPLSPVPTPGAVNSVKLDPALIPPAIRQVDHSPRAPVPGQVVTITAKVTDPDGVDSVTLDYQIVEPGAYIRLGDPAYAASWTTVTMKDNGLSGDATAKDSIYTVRIPASVQQNRRLIRYRIHFSDDLGNSAVAPYADDEQPNFAYFVYAGLPAWQGAFRPTTIAGSTEPPTPVQSYPASLLDDLPVYTLIANVDDIVECQYETSGDHVRFPGTFVHDGKVYDHIQFRNRGEASTYKSGKNKWRYYFNRSRDFPAKDNFGGEYRETWGSFSADACSSPWAALHRGMAGVEEAVSYKIFQLGGLASPNTHYFHLRVIRGPNETPAAGTVINDPIGEEPVGNPVSDGQYAGDFWGLYLALEQPDGSFLDERGLPDGNLYKIGASQGDKKHQGFGQPVNSSDWNAFRDAYKGAGAPTESWWRANMDMEAYYTFHTLSRLTGNVDLRTGYNHYFHHRVTDGRWVPIPWDLDMMFIAKRHQTTDISGNEIPGVIYAHESIQDNPALHLEFRNRAREILDLLGSDSAPGGGQFGQLVDEFAQIVNPAGLALTWADADAAMWNLHPRSSGTDGRASGQFNHRGNFYRTSFGDTRNGGSWTRWLRSPTDSGIMAHEDAMAFLRDYSTNAWPGGPWTANNGNQLGYGYQYVLSESADPDIPQTPVATATGDPAFPVSDLVFTSSSFSDPQGSGTFAKTQWRLAEISGPGVPGYVAGTPRTYEIDPIWTEEFTSTTASVRIPYGIADPGKSYRVRVRHQDNSGRWSHWSAPAAFTATPPPPGLLLHYWNFNGANLLTPTQTIGGAALAPTLNGSATVIADNNEGFIAENARNGDPAGNHFRLNYPLDATLDIALPTTGYGNIVAKYETRRSGQGAGTQDVYYTVDGTTYLPFTSFVIADSAPVLRILDFRNIPEANDNPLFALRIAFQQGDGGIAGNNRFDNLTLEGDPFALEPGTYAYWRAENFPEPGDFANDALSGPDASAAGDGISNILRYALGAGPHDPVTHLLPKLTAVPGFTFSFRFDPSLTDLIWRVKASPDLDDWSTVLFDSVTDTPPPLVDGWLPVELPASLGGGPLPDPRIFTRLELLLDTP
ncbi:lamin tail domain-containing protein [Luteolibacter marinus]|uniref:lamin tail domain-containing protein n=1 Tax=Luteolibacter marinus TaxID=2776705 RepID=UPI001866A128|nr:lamin tail domain-containing protein [Luteolibacter marinus]